MEDKNAITSPSGAPPLWRQEEEEEEEEEEKEEEEKEEEEEKSGRGAPTCQRS